MCAEVWTIARKGLLAFIEDDDLSRGAAIAFYAVTGFVPALILAVTLLSAVFGAELIHTVIAHALHILMGREADGLMAIAARSVSGSETGLRAEAIGGAILVIAASGALSEIRTALNAIWKVRLQQHSWGQFLRARLVSLFLVLALGALLLASTLATAVIALLVPRLHFELGVVSALVRVANFLLSLVLAAILFAAIYKVLPDVDLKWSDVGVGAGVTALLYELGQVLIWRLFRKSSPFYHARRGRKHDRTSALDLLLGTGLPSRC